MPNPSVKILLTHCKPSSHFIKKSKGKFGKAIPSFLPHGICKEAVAYPVSVLFGPSKGLDPDTISFGLEFCGSAAGGATNSFFNVMYHDIKIKGTNRYTHKAKTIIISIFTKFIF